MNVEAVFQSVMTKACYFCVTFCLLLIFFAPSFAQDKVKKTETISTASKITSGQLKLNENKTIEVKGTAVFTLAAVNPDGSLSGNLVYIIHEDVRQKIAQEAHKQIAEVPANIAVKDVSAKLKKNTHCPEIQLAFAELETEISGTKLHLNHFVLNFIDTPQKLSRALCIWTDRANKGDNNKGIVQYINLLLKGEEDEEDKPATHN